MIKTSETEHAPGRDDFFRAPVFVLGLPRSGTSLVAGILHLCGAWKGDTVPGGGTENPKGFFENKALRETVNKPLLRERGHDPVGVRSLPPLDSLAPIPGFDRRIEAILSAEGYPGDRPWLFKDAKLTLLWPLYAAAFPGAHWIIVRRAEEDIIKSCLNTRFMRHHSDDPAFWRNWIAEYLERLESLKSSGARWSELWSQEVIEGRWEDLRSLAGELGLDWPGEKVRRFVDPEFWHGGRSQ